MCGDEGVGGDDLLGAAFFAPYAHTLGGELCGVIAVVCSGEIEGFGRGSCLRAFGMALAVDLALGVKIVDHESDDLHDLRIGERGFVCVKIAEAFDSVFLEHIEKLELVAREFGFNVVRLAHKADVDSRIGAGKHEDILAVKEARVDREYVRFAAE